MCKTFKKFPDDPEIEDMDPVMRAWMFYNWIEDYGDDFKLLENQGYLIGSFTNPEAVKKILGQGGDSYVSSDEEFEEASRRLIEENRKIDEERAEAAIPKKRRKRKITG